MARAGLKKVVKTVKGKRGPSRRAYWVKSGSPTQKKQGRIGRAAGAVGGFLGRHKGKLAAIAVIAGALYGAHRLTRGGKHSGPTATSAGGGGPHPPDRPSPFGAVTADPSRRKQPGKIHATPYSYGEGPVPPGFVQGIGGPPIPIAPKRPLMERLRPLFDTIPEHHRVVKHRVDHVSMEPSAVAARNIRVTNVTVDTNAWVNKRAREGRMADDPRYVLNGPTSGTQLMGRDGGEIRGLHYAPNAMRGGGGVFTSPSVLAHHRSRGIQVAPTTAAEASRAHHTAHSPISLGEIGHGVLRSVAPIHALGNARYTNQRSHVPYKSSAHQRRGMLMGMLR
jgi:hypothetical protein